MSARSAEAPGVGWLPMGEELHDPGVALDLASTLEPRDGAAVIRVAATPGSRAFSACVGDWLCDPERPGSNSRLSFGGWEIAGRGSRAWASGRERIDAWDECPSGRWLVGELVAVGAPPWDFVLAACACAALAARSAGSSALADAMGAVALARRGDLPAFEDRMRVHLKTSSSALTDAVTSDAEGTPLWFAAAACYNAARAAWCVVKHEAGSSGWSGSRPVEEAGDRCSEAADDAAGLVGQGAAADAVRAAVQPIVYLRACARLPSGAGGRLP